MDEVVLPKNREQLESLCHHLLARVNQLEEMVRLMQRRRFGPSSEAANHPGMRSLFPKFEEDEPPPSWDDKASETEIKAHKRKCGRKPLAEHLARKEILLDLAEEEKQCSCCKRQLDKISEKITEKLHIKPAEYLVYRYIRPVYSCKGCEAIKTTPLPKHPIPKCSVTVPSLAGIMVSKYVDSLPLYRQEQIFARSGVELGRDKMARWILTLGEKLSPLTSLLHKKLLSSRVIAMDETTLQVLKEKGRAASSKSFILVQAREGPNGQNIILFHYNQSRAGHVIDSYLSGFNGILLTDGLEVYKSYCHNRANIIHAGCWSHCRRKFAEAQKGIKNSKRAGSIAYQAINHIDELFKVEAEGKNLPAEQRLELRRQKSQIIIDKLETLLKEKLLAVPKRSLTGMALHYMNNEWSRLTKFLRYGEVAIHNNLVENHIRPVALGRKNWLFCDQVKGAQASTAIYSLISTAKANGLNPYDYLCQVLAEIDGCHTDEQREALLPFKK